MQLLGLLDAIPDAIDADPKLGGRLLGGMVHITGARLFKIGGASTTALLDHTPARALKTSDLNANCQYNTTIEQNDGSVFFHGVLLRDLTDEEFAALQPGFIQRRAPPFPS